jgi:bifunctional UDP-N-acetylglucosamine pyrophosphorylase / glucosamine-1-phosphate N-acetyltransferase
MRRVLVVPAAGTGSRLGSPGPKVLHSVAGRSMLAHIAQRFARWVDAMHLVVRPQDHDAVAAECAALRLRASLHLQPQPTGMLDAVLCAHPAVMAGAPREVWIVWCDQIALRTATLKRLAGSVANRRAAIRLPTCLRADPYIHLERDASGRIVRVRHRREGDAMPELGETDAGVFALRDDVYGEYLPRFALEAVAVGIGTRERNFLPFLAWPGLPGPVASFPCEDASETIGVNTPADLRVIENLLAAR